jgi:hypothetical protein
VTVKTLTTTPSFSTCWRQVSSHSASAPASATMRPPTSWIHGLTLPYPGRGRMAETISTSPARPSTIRITRGASSRGGMKSRTRTDPIEVRQTDSRTSESPRYRRSATAPEQGRPTGEVGAICQVPCFWVPSRPAKTAGESNRGRHNQSIEPSSQTWALVCMSPIRPYCSIRGGHFIVWISVGPATPGLALGPL